MSQQISFDGKSTEDVPENVESFQPCQKYNNELGRSLVRVRSKEEKAEKGVPTTFTPVPTEARAALQRETRRNSREAKSTSQKRQKSKDSKKTRDDESVPTKSTPESAVDTDYLRTAIPISVYFMQRKIGTTEIPCDGTLRLVLQFALDRIGMKIKNHFSFYVFGSIFEVQWARSKCALMKTPASENMFRRVLKPSMVDQSLIDLRRVLDIEEMNSLNIYIFMKELNDDYSSSEDVYGTSIWKFHHVK